MNSVLKKLSIPASAIILLLSSCTKNFDEINTDPDALNNVPPGNMLINVLRNTGESFGGDVDGYGTFGGYIVKIQYMDKLDGLIPTNNTYGNRWYACYYNNTQLNDLLEKTDAQVEGYKNIRMIARIWQNYMWSYLTDGWRDVPYTEALQGMPDKGSLLKAKYDKQEDIYPAVLKSLKELADEMATGHGTDEVGDFDIIYKGNMLSWQKFCNSLRLRMAMRISGVSPALAKSTIEEITGNKAKYPILETNEENCDINYPGALPYFEPWYNSGIYSKRIDNWGMFDIFIDYMKSVNDPRIAAVAQKNNTGEYVGFKNGLTSGPPVLRSVSWIGNHYINDPAGSTPFYKSCETYYTLAEAAMLGYNVGISAKDAYEKAVKLSMEDNEVAQTDITAYLAAGGKWNNTKERIWWDMWVALFKENFEAWSLYRRTGIPTTNYASLNSIYKETHDEQPYRLPYPNNEYLYNKVNVEAAAKEVADHAWGKKMWWDTRPVKIPHPGE
ncbi:SusD/RagB family nutrient-binding outer membrane lipoprotein [Sphingobacterium sp. SRCM116780]|uniref:SusD/RagB family nutrient-binding outer membrane lipoprotein n=1 Tax=Sphingobacterium sp. SRCM116780 TaxID=2907623 RepID=UPI001F231999|nr:SusD/RagB family nutrient-binding outer membrane lipoprotein [Sphingobacterium sp. SRCM116780]UIR54632.1 SusD/RagB family nutrient-binding outer membrane lipoprotein [Sphingobacterium sp. SRCM116780]